MNPYFDRMSTNFYSIEYHPYHLDNKCFTCLDNFEASKCHTCMPGFLATVDKMYCGQYMPDCPLNYTSIPNACYHCPIGKLRNKSYTTCGNNITYCKFINDSMTACEICFDGYLRSKNLVLCGPNIQNCLFVNNTNILQCDTCAVGFTLTTSRKKCVLTIPNC